MRHHLRRLRGHPRLRRLPHRPVPDVQSNRHLCHDCAQGQVCHKEAAARPRRARPSSAARSRMAAAARSIAARAPAMKRASTTAVSYAAIRKSAMVPAPNNNVPATHGDDCCFCIHGFDGTVDYLCVRTSPEPAVIDCRMATANARQGGSASRPGKCRAIVYPAVLTPGRATTNSVPGRPGRPRQSASGRRAPFHRWQPLA